MSTASTLHAGPVAGLRRRAIGRRIATSDPVARVIAEHAFGSRLEFDTVQPLGELANAIVAGLSVARGGRP